MTPKPIQKIEKEINWTKIGGLELKTFEMSMFLLVPKLPIDYQSEKTVNYTMATKTLNLSFG